MTDDEMVISKKDSDYDYYHSSGSNQAALTGGQMPSWTIECKTQQELLHQLQEENRLLHQLLSLHEEMMAMKDNTIGLLSPVINSQQFTIEMLSKGTLGKRKAVEGLPLDSNVEAALISMSPYLGTQEQRQKLSGVLREMFEREELRVHDGQLFVRNGKREFFLRHFFEAMSRDRQQALLRKDNTKALNRLKLFLHNNLLAFKGGVETQVEVTHFDQPLRRIISHLRNKGVG